MLMHENHMIKCVVGTQEEPALSSGESEWYSLVRSAASVIGMANMARDLGVTLKPRLAGDATAAAGIAKRRGAGKLRHVETKTLWLQRQVTKKKVTIRRILGKELPLDMGTKFLPQATMNKFLTALGFHTRSGKSKLALSAAL